MTETKFTPGPWQVGPIMPGEPNRINGSRTVEAPYDGETQTLAFVHPSTTGEGSTKIDAEERDANARLIAAAPEMFAALEQTLAWIENLKDLSVSLSIAEEGDEEEHIDVLRAALQKAKAKGGAK